MDCVTSPAIKAKGRLKPAVRQVPEEIELKLAVNRRGISRLWRP